MTSDRTLREKLAAETCEFCRKKVPFDKTGSSHHTPPTGNYMVGDYDECTSLADKLLPIIRQHAAQVARSVHDAVDSPAAHFAIGTVITKLENMQ